MQRAADLPAADDWLSASESATLSSLRIAKRRDDWRLGRWTAKRAVAVHVGGISAQWSSIEIRAADSGVPEVFIDRQRAPLALSISHSAGRALCSLAPGGIALGCDIEAVAPRSAAFVADYFTVAEREAIKRAPVLEQPVLATLLWSAKESALKALREGLRLDTRSVSVILGGGEPVRGWRALSVYSTGAAQVFGGWWRTHEGYVLTIVAFPPCSPPAALVLADSSERAAAGCHIRGR
jgi:4'-phosphopantetheinyl transferase